MTQTTLEQAYVDTEKMQEDLLRQAIVYRHDPLGWVLYSFPWGEEGELEEYIGPDYWQTEVLSYLTDRLKNHEITPLQVVGIVTRIAIGAGNGPGKSALVSWLILWAMSTLVDTRGVITANTDTQLKTKTWAELAKWYRLCIYKHWFVMTATAIYAKDKEHERTWRIDAVPWSEENVEAFAGLHNKGKRILLVFDESSAIPDKIWETAEGALTDRHTEIIWLVSGNPTRNTGRFRQCWGKSRLRWQTWQIDIRKSALVNQEEVKGWIEDYGIDSDWVRVHVLGLFPSASDLQFIPTNLAEEAMKRKIGINQCRAAPKIIGVDPAWTGGDEIVIGLRQGLSSRILQTFPKNDDDSVIAAAVIHHENTEHADAVFIDQAYGTGIYSFGKTLNHKWTLVNFGAKSTRLDCANKRSQMWHDMKDWLKEGGQIEDTPRMKDDLIGPEAYPNLKDQIVLESKKSMKKRGLASPGRGDAIALTFALPVRKKSPIESGEQPEFATGHDYDPLA